MLKQAVATSKGQSRPRRNQQYCLFFGRTPPVKSILQSQGETIVINGDINITILKIEGDEVIFEIDAPEWIAIEEQPAAAATQVRRTASLPAR
jgi:carbon storage regulator CsrA